MGAAVLEAMKELGVTRDELAARLGVSPSLLSMVAGGKRRPSPALALLLAAELGVDPEELWGIDVTPLVRAALRYASQRLGEPHVA